MLRHPLSSREVGFTTKSSTEPSVILTILRDTAYLPCPFAVAHSKGTTHNGTRTLALLGVQSRVPRERNLNHYRQRLLRSACNDSLSPPVSESSPIGQLNRLGLPCIQSVRLDKCRNMIQPASRSFSLGNGAAKTAVKQLNPAAINM